MQLGVDLVELRGAHRKRNAAAAGRTAVGQGVRARRQHKSNRIADRASRRRRVGARHGLSPHDISGAERIGQRPQVGHLHVHVHLAGQIERRHAGGQAGALPLAHPHAQRLAQVAAQLNVEGRVLADLEAGRRAHALARGQMVSDSVHRP